MPYVAPNGEKFPDNCCVVPDVDRDGVCRNCGYDHSENDNWVFA